MRSRSSEGTNCSAPLDTIRSMAEKRKRVKPGDVLEFATNDERAYLHYIGKHSEYGDAVVVCPERYEKRPANMTGIFDSGYVVFYPVTAAAAQGFIDVV